MTVGLIILIVFGDLLCGFLGFLFYKKLGREYIEIDYLSLFMLLGCITLPTSILVVLYERLQDFVEDYL